MPSLLRALGAAAGDYPGPWDPACFNLTLKVEFPHAGTPTVSPIIGHF